MPSLPPAVTPGGILPPSSEIAWLTQYLIDNDRPDDLLTVSTRLLGSEQNNPILLNNAIYLSLIMGRGVSEGGHSRIVEISESLAKRHPGVLGIRTTLALAYMEAGRHEEAKAVFRPEEFSGIGWQKFGPSDRAIFAVVLEANGFSGHALNVKQRVSWSEMLEVERAFFRQYLPSNAVPPVESSDRGSVAGTGEDQADETPEISPQRNPPEESGEASGSETGAAFPSARLKLLEERLEAERKAREEGTVSERVRLLEERQSSEKEAASAGFVSPRQQMLRQQESPPEAEAE